MGAATEAAGEAGRPSSSRGSGGDNERATTRCAMTTQLDGCDKSPSEAVTSGDNDDDRWMVIDDPSSLVRTPPTPTYCKSPAIDTFLFARCA